VETDGRIEHSAESAKRRRRIGVTNTLTSLRFQKLAGCRPAQGVGFHLVAELGVIPVRRIAEPDREQNQSADDFGIPVGET